MLMKPENVERLRAYQGDPIERIALLELHLRRLLEAGAELRVTLRKDEWQPEAKAWDQAESDAEGVLHG